MQGMNRRGLQTAPPSSTQGLRMKRAIIGRRAAPTTPVPSWKVFNNQLYDGMTVAGGRPPPASARKLAASLWELQDLPLPACLSACLYSPHWIPPSPKDSPDTASPYSQPEYVLSPPSSKSGNHRYSQAGANTSSRYEQGSSIQTHLHRLLSKSSMTAHAPITVERQRHVPCSLFTGTRKGEVESGHNTGHNTVTALMSQELLKVFSQIRLLEEQHNSSVNLTAALHAELLQAQARVRELELPQRIARREVESLVKKFSDEKTSWKVKEKDKIKAAVQPVKQELEEERKARQRLETANRRLTKELQEAQKATAKALQELENERKARELMEEVCNELAHETGDEKAEVEELKRQSLKAREELEEERRMLQLAEVWREERVQMKLGEAKLALEEKSAALDVMRAELESFLAKRDGNKYNSTTLREAQVLHNVINAVHHSTSVSTFPPTETTHVVPPDTDLYTLEMTDQEGPKNEPAQAETLPLYYPEGIPDAD